MNGFWGKLVFTIHIFGRYFFSIKIRVLDWFQLLYFVLTCPEQLYITEYTRQWGVEFNIFLNFRWVPHVYKDMFCTRCDILQVITKLIKSCAHVIACIVYQIYTKYKHKINLILSHKAGQYDIIWREFEYITV